MNKIFNFEWLYCFVYSSSIASLPYDMLEQLKDIDGIQNELNSDEQTHTVPFHWGHWKKKSLFTAPGFLFVHRFFLCAFVLFSPFCFSPHLDLFLSSPLNRYFGATMWNQAIQDCHQTTLTRDPVSASEKKKQTSQHTHLSAITASQMYHYLLLTWIKSKRS